MRKGKNSEYRYHHPDVLESPQPHHAAGGSGMSGIAECQDGERAYGKTLTVSSTEELVEFFRSGNQEGVSAASG